MIYWLPAFYFEFNIFYLLFFHFSSFLNLLSLFFQAVCSCSYIIQYHFKYYAYLHFILIISNDLLKIINLINILYCLSSNKHFLIIFFQIIWFLSNFKIWAWIETFLNNWCNWIELIVRRVILIGKTRNLVIGLGRFISKLNCFRL